MLKEVVKLASFPICGPIINNKFEFMAEEKSGENKKKERE